MEDDVFTEEHREMLRSHGFHEEAYFENLHHFLSRVKRAAKTMKKNGRRPNFFKLLTDAFQVVYGRQREKGSLGNIN